MTEIDKWLYLQVCHQSLTECTWGMLVMYRTHPASHDQTQVCQVAKLLEENMPTVSSRRWKSSPPSAKPYVREDFLPLFYYIFIFCQSESGKILTGRLGPRRQMDRLWCCDRLWHRLRSSKEAEKHSEDGEELETYFQTGEYIIKKTTLRLFPAFFNVYFKKTRQCSHLVSLISFQLPDCLSFWLHTLL